MFKTRVKYMLLLLIATTLYIVWINFGTGRTLLDVFVPNQSKKQTLKKRIEHVALECNYDINDYNDIIKSITRAMDFFQLYITDLVLDAAVGTRMLQGQLQIILQNFNLPSAIRMQLEQLLKNTKHVSDKIVMHFVDVMKASDQSPAGKKRFQQNLHWIKGGSLWEMPTAGDWQEKSDSIEKSEESSKCSFKDSMEKSSSILRYFVSSLKILISLKVFILGGCDNIDICRKAKKCFDNEEYMKKLTQLGNPNDILASFCAKIFHLAQNIEDAEFPVFRRDLFNEQIVVCSMSGFQQFLQISWLRTILSWQSSDLLGCYELPKTGFSRTFDDIYGIKKKSKRVKRFDNVISTGSQNCSTHFTGTAVASIGMYLRYLVETCSEKLFNEQRFNRE